MQDEGLHVDRRRPCRHVTKRARHRARPWQGPMGGASAAYGESCCAMRLGCVCAYARHESPSGEHGAATHASGPGTRKCGRYRVKASASASKKYSWPSYDCTAM